MKTWYLTFTDGSHGVCDGESEYDAKIISEKLTGKVVAGGAYKDVAAKILPYPARGRIWAYAHPIHGTCPDFCYTPETCAGKTACPKPHACDD